MMIMELGMKKSTVAMISRSIFFSLPFRCLETTLVPLESQGISLLVGFLALYKKDANDREDGHHDSPARESDQEARDDLVHGVTLAGVDGEVKAFQTGSNLLKSEVGVISRLPGPVHCTVCGALVVKTSHFVGKAAANDIANENHRSELRLGLHGLTLPWMEMEVKGFLG
jgi:hypothetical protein